jgi:hypothetical protein
LATADADTIRECAMPITSAASRIDAHVFS